MPPFFIGHSAKNKHSILHFIFGPYFAAPQSQNPLFFAECLRWAICLIACLALTGCVGNDLMLKRQAEAEAKIEHLLQTGKKGEQRMNDLFADIQIQDDQAKAAAVQLTQLQSILQELRIEQAELKAEVTLLTQHAATPKIEVVNPEAAPKGKDSGPPPEYVKAFGLYSANNFNAAIEAFGEFIRNNPLSNYAANAIYWIGECHYSQSDMVKAQAFFQKVMDAYPKSNKAPDALLKLGYVLSAMKDKNKAMVTFENVIKLYPSSPAAAKARERLTAN